MVLFIHTRFSPVMVGGAGVTVNIPVAKQVGDDRKVIVAVPIATPVTNPEVLATLAIAVLLLDQVPTEVVVSVNGDPTQIVPVVPAAGGAETVTIRVVKQPEPAE